MALTRVKSAGVTSGSFLASGSAIPVSSGGTGRTSQMVSSWVLNPQHSSASSGTTMEWSKDTASTTDNLLGTDVTMSSGVITFPSTGLYKLTIDLQGRHSSSNVTYTGWTWEHSSNSGVSYSTVWRKLDCLIAGGYFTMYSDMFYNVTDTSTQRLYAKSYTTAASGLVFDGGQGYTSCRLYIEKYS